MKRCNSAASSFARSILPPMSHIASASLERIREFAAAGGLVLALDPQPPEIADIPGIRRFPILPHDPMLTLDYLTRFQTTAPMRQALAPLFDALRATVAPAVDVVEGSREDLYFSRRAAGDIEWFWAVNDSAAARDVTVCFPSPGNYERWDAETGSRHLLSSNSTVALHFEPWDAFFVVRNPQTSSVPPLPSRQRHVLVDLSDNQWQFAPESPVRVPYAQIAGSAEPVWLSPERLAQRNWWLSGPYPYGDHEGFFQRVPARIRIPARHPHTLECPTLAICRIAHLCRAPTGAKRRLLRLQLRLGSGRLPGLRRRWR